MSSRAGFSALLLLGISFAQPTAGQAPPPAEVAARPEFEVASIKVVSYAIPPNGVRLITRHGSLTTRAASLKQLIALAYGVQTPRVLGGPDWLDRDRFDILAKGPDPKATSGAIGAMTQSLLADRFKLAVHWETKQLPMYALTVGKGGPKLHEAKPDEQFDATKGVTSAGVQWSYRRASMVQVVALLSYVLDGPVLDKTGLTGWYDFSLEYARSSIRPAGDGAAAESGPSLFTALQEQLGLKLEEKKGPVEVVVVDRAEHASEN